MDRSFNILGLFVLLSAFEARIWARETVRCTTKKEWYGKYYHTTYTYCRHRCCGSYPNEYCCNDCDQSDYSGTIVGSIIGSMLLLSCIMTVIYCVVKRKSCSSVSGQTKVGVDMATNTENIQQEFPQQASMNELTPRRQLLDEVLFNNSDQELPAVVFTKHKHID